jgi:Protein of unknown function (DUF2846)
MSTRFAFTTATPLSPAFATTMAAAFRLITIFIACAFALALGGCATGAPFTAPAAVPEGQAQVYLYRKSALQSGGQSFTVQVNKKDAGELFNGSYMQLPLAPGEHLVTVKPGPFSKTYEHTVKLESNQTQYLEFELPAFFLANAFMLGSGITAREADKANADLQGLKGVK